MLEAIGKVIAFAIIVSVGVGAAIAGFYFGGLAYEPCSHRPGDCLHIAGGSSE